MNQRSSLTVSDGGHPGGFSLVELLVVMVIITILAGIMLYVCRGLI